MEMIVLSFMLGIVAAIVPVWIVVAISSKDEKESEMTRELAIKHLRDYLKHIDARTAFYHAMIEAISALEQEPYETSTDEPMTMVYPTIFCEDAISREAFITRYREWMKSEYGKIPDDDTLAIRVIKSLPSVTQKSGKWIPVSERSAKVPCLASDNYKNQPFVVTEVITEKYENGSIRCFDARGFSFSEKAAEWPKREIIAWMPLPKPYEPQESEDKE